LRAFLLDIYGDGDGKQGIMRAIDERRVAQGIGVHRPIPQPELFKRLSGYDVGLAYVPRRPYGAALPLKTLEYLACGLPVVAANTVGNRMAVQSGVNGLLVDEDTYSFAKGICELAKCRGSRRPLRMHDILLSPTTG
jgi:glycosyltransferase involved in cell wall biosynthesis